MRARPKIDDPVVNWHLVQKPYDFYSYDVTDTRPCSRTGQSGIADVGVADCMVVELLIQAE